MNDMTQSLKALPYSENEHGCHIFTLTARDRNGYARVRVGDRLKYAHVVAYEQHHGPVPAGQEVMHAKGCARDCINPDHLSAGTHQQNMADIKEHKKAYCTNGHELTLSNSYSWNNRTMCKVCKAKARL